MKQQLTALVLLCLLGISTSYSLADAQSVYDVPFVKQMYSAANIPWCNYVSGGCGEGWSTIYHTIDYLDSGHIVVFGNVNVNPQNANGLYLFDRNGNFLAKKSYRIETGLPYNSGHSGFDGVSVQIVPVGSPGSGLFLIMNRSGRDGAGVHLYRASNSAPHLTLVDFLGRPSRDPDVAGIGNPYYGSESREALAGGFLFITGDYEYPESLEVYRVTSSGFEFVRRFDSTTQPIVGVGQHFIGQNGLSWSVYNVKSDGTFEEEFTFENRSTRFFRDRANPNRLGLYNQKTDALDLYESRSSGFALIESRPLAGYGRASGVDGSLYGEYFAYRSNRGYTERGSRLIVEKNGERLSVEDPAPRLPSGTSLDLITAVGILPTGHVIAGHQTPGGELLMYQISELAGTTPSTPISAPSGGLTTSPADADIIRAVYVRLIEFYVNAILRLTATGGQGDISDLVTKLETSINALAPLLQNPSPPLTTPSTPSTPTTPAPPSTPSTPSGVCTVGTKQCAAAFGIGSTGAGVSIQTCQLVNGAAQWVTTENCQTGYYCFTNRVNEGCVYDPAVPL